MRETIGGIFLAVSLLLILKFMLVSLPFLPGLVLVLLFVIGTGLYAVVLDRKIGKMSDRTQAEAICETDLNKGRFFKTTGMTIWIVGCLYVVFEFFHLIFLAFSDSWKFGALAILHVMTGPFLLIVIAFPIHWIGELYETKAEKM